MKKIIYTFILVLIVHYTFNIENCEAQWQTDVSLTNDPAGSFTSLNNTWCVASNGSIVHVVWSDNRDGGNPDIYYKRNPTDNLVGINKINSEIPSSFSLSQNYPNPFNPTTNVQFSMFNFQFVTLKVFDILGREVVTLVNEKLSPGTYTVDWNASEYPSGVYFYRLQTEGFTETKKMSLIK